MVVGGGGGVSGGGGIRFEISSARKPSGSRIWMRKIGRGANLNSRYSRCVSNTQVACVAGDEEDEADDCDDVNA